MITWGRLTGPALVAGSIGGTLGGLISWLAYAAYLDPGFTNFFNTTSRQDVLLLANGFCLGLGIVLPIAITYATTWNWSKIVLNPDTVWDCVRDIDNPLKPWTEIYAKSVKPISTHP
ncbi:unnamed protein product [Protopolystoma xenopodis]|uniref:Uncharacterized protein n=1 Tax=Protopolystoma xenopodis TaxID=117903 RepID=A0A448XAN4_9PLAT|nr:unnamed protein product [Protopolystoma xenopodis]